MQTIISDNAIPLIKQLLPTAVRLIQVPADQITSRLISHADALFVRTVTQVDKPLLQNSSIRFVGSMSAGKDHLDTSCLDKNQIQWTTAAGCNANAVAQYVITCLALLRKKNRIPKQKLRAGIIGVGHVGTKVRDLLEPFCETILLNDPPKKTTHPNIKQTSLDAFHHLDLISLHTPLILNGPWPTEHLVDINLLSKQNPGCILINTSRGKVISGQTLKESDLTYCLDVFEHEPNIDPELVQQAFIATPHIAGYSLNAKLSASIQVIKTAYGFFGWENNINDNAILQQHLPQPNLTFDTPASWEDVVLSCYNIEKDHQSLQNILTHNTPKRFETLRREYTLRTEFEYFNIKCKTLAANQQRVLQHLGFAPVVPA